MGRPSSLPPSSPVCLSDDGGGSFVVDLQQTRPFERFALLVAGVFVLLAIRDSRSSVQFQHVEAAKEKHKVEIVEYVEDAK